eukprot:GILJ01008801.1.p1 GENE.GILJ01008801.1~~GILJ01008801.1.p1  ORF type:complete len:165 (+),score=25.00 GILJ01008801.1:26-520(+)
MAQESRSTFEKVTNLLQQHGVAFTLTEHEAVRTSAEAAAVRGTALASGAKAMLLNNSKSKESPFVLAVMSASRKLDSKVFKSILGTKSMRFATEEEVLQITGCIPGAVPPFGSTFGVRTYMDESLTEQGSSIDFNAGLRTHSVAMSTQDFVKVEAPVVCRFTTE